MKLRKIEKLAWISLALTVLLAGCTSYYQSTSAIQKNVEEERLVPAAAVAENQILDEYDHHLPLPVKGRLGLHLTVDNPFVPMVGGTAIVQIGIATQRPKIDVSHLHLMVSTPRVLDEDLNMEIGRIIRAANRGTSGLPDGSTFSVDWMRPERKGDAALASPLRPGNPSHENALQFFRSMLMFPFGKGKHHLVWVVAEHGVLGRTQRQHIMDMARFLSSRSVGLSVVALGDKPDIGFLTQLCEAGNGQFYVHTTNTSLDQWFAMQIEQMHATALNDISIRLDWALDIGQPRFMPGSALKPVNAGRRLVLDHLMLGRQRVVLAEIPVPAAHDMKAIEVLRASVEYFDAQTRQYQATGPIPLTLTYAADQRKTRSVHHPLVQRSLSLIKIPDVIQAVADMLRQQRPYQGMALLSSHSRELRSLGRKLNDQAMLRDAQILDNYTARLFNFADESFRGFKTWRDLSWDSGRFENSVE